NLDEDEIVEKVVYELDDVKKAVEARKNEDAKTFIAFQHLLLHYNHSK
ncbi:ADP-ribose pyrophosphatase, partial [Staphylococcus pseudintermedius]